MFILDKPYISQFALQSAETLEIPVLRTPAVEAAARTMRLNLVDDAEAVRLQRLLPRPFIYTNSENSLGWVSQHLAFSDLPRTVDVFKNKILFRELLRPLFPDFGFSSVALRDLGSIEVVSLEKPFVIKPAVGFFSLGVHKVSDDSQWPAVLSSIRQEMLSVEGVFPREVMDATRFIVEQAIEGEEYAVDAYYDADGRPVILNILFHPFSSDEDVSDRVYATSCSIVRQWRPRFQELLERIGGLIELRNFPVHVELRVGADGTCIPVEVNPMRFAGWCTTDIAHYAFGVNVYAHYFHQIESDWSKIAVDNAGDIYALVVAEVPSRMDRSCALSMDWDRFLSNFSSPLEVRPINFREYPVMAFLFVKVPGNAEGERELQRILRMDMGDYLLVSE